VRVGFGYDVHPLLAGRRLVLAGCHVPFEKGLAGYSDADAIAHAVIDALLGAAALGDCGTHFPAGAPEFAGADSIGLLARAAKMVRDAGYAIVNVDATVVAEKPALAPHIPSMRANLSRAMQIEPERCSVKAKHSEGLGFAGEGKGMAAYATACLEELR